MNDYKKPIGKGAAWIKEGKKGKFLSGEITFSFEEHQITTRILAFKNLEKTGNLPDYNLLVVEAFPTKPRENKKTELSQPTDEEENIPF